MESPGVSPLPVLVQDFDGSQTQYCISSQALSTIDIDVLRHYRCFETPQGWVLAHDPASLLTFLWRPQDGERIQLPPTEQAFPQHCKCLLSDMPDAASGCAVVVFDLDVCRFWFCKIGATKPEWIEHTYESTMFLDGKTPPPTNIANFRGIAAVSGKIYFESQSYELGVIDFNGNEQPKLDIISVDLPRPVAPIYFVESRGELFIVVIFFDFHNVHNIFNHAVYKMDFSKRVWSEVGEIGGDRVFLLGGHIDGTSRFGASCSAGDGLPGNCIYFLNHMDFTKSALHVIDLKKGTHIVQRPFKHNGYQIPLRSPIWLLPTERPCFQAQGSSFLRCNLRRLAKIGLFTFSCIFLFIVFLFRTM